MDENFIRTTHSVGVGDQWPFWAVAPECLGQRLLDVAKRASRFVKRAAPGMSHSACLEVVARGAGLPDWYTLQSMAQGLINDFHPDRHWPRPKGSRERAAALAPAFPMLVTVNEERAPTAEQERGMRLFADRLSAACSLSPAAALGVVARMNGADTWEALTQRRPEDSAKPLYRFDIGPDGGYFTWSTSCGDLVDEQDKLYQGYWSKTDDERAQCAAWVYRTTAQRPDFLEGLLAKADILNHPLANPRESGRTYAEAIAAAERLMPEGFEGEVTWLRVESRFYHRLLYGYMQWNILHGSRARAVELARKQLRLNPNDNLGLRYFLPVLLAAAGKLSPALKALDRFDGDMPHDAGPPFVRSLVFAALGRRRDALRELLHALFVFPGVRAVVALDSDEQARAIAASQRGIILDLDTLDLQFVAVSARVPWMDEVFCAWVDHPEVRGAEEWLGALYRRSKEREHWVQQVLATARDVSELLEPGVTPS